jgi:transcription antitermination factor NusG
MERESERKPKKAPGKRMSFWSVVQTTTGHEMAVAERIERSGFETFTPKAKFRIHERERITPIFQGYVFTLIEAGWYQVRWTQGVLRIIMSGDQPAAVPDDELRRLLAMTDEDGLVVLPAAPEPPPLIIGATVRIATGSFKGFIAIYDGMSPRDREKVLLDMLGRQVPVELSRDDRIEPV